MARFWSDPKRSDDDRWSYDICAPCASNGLAQAVADVHYENKNYEASTWFAPKDQLAASEPLEPGAGYPAEAYDDGKALGAPYTCAICSAILDSTDNVEVAHA